MTAGQLFIFSIIRFECCLFLNLYKVLGCSWYSWKNGFQVFCHSIQWLENSEFRKSNLNYHYNIPRTNAMGTSWNNNRYCVPFVKSFVLFCFEARIYHTMHTTHPAPSFTSCNSPHSFYSLTIRFVCKIRGWRCHVYLASPKWHHFRTARDSFSTSAKMDPYWPFPFKKIVCAYRLLSCFSQL